MKRILATSLVALLIIAILSTWSWAQAENLSAGRGLGFGVRFLPQALMPMATSDIDSSLGSALVVQYWFSDLMAAEAGGWISSFSDNMNPHSFTSLSGGLLYKLSDNVEFDAYVTARVMTAQNVYTNCCIVYGNQPPPPEPKPAQSLQNGTIAPPWPGASSESRSSTLAFEVAGGIERSLSLQVTTNVEFGLVYGQTITTNAPMAIEPPVPGPIQPVSSQIVASSSLGITLHLSLNFYLPRK